ncbi:MAG TPA: glycosyltransferase family 1 protein [Chloroflexi bacterium]|nr:glycosyltransferase family 1 protein [Chloroflexota bacterium]HHW89167.1 glycosyltransferase family 4 protein [Chloroflexota bacterium]
MRVAIDAQLLSDQQSYRGAGVSNYSAELLRALGALVQEEQARLGDAPAELTAYLHAAHFTAPGVQLVRARLPLENPLARILWEQTLFPLALRRQRASLVHGLVNVLPLTASCPGVVTVHDLAFVRTPATMRPLKRIYLTALCRASVRRAAHVIAVSHQTATDLQHFWGTPSERITVVHHGVAARFTPRCAEEQAAFRQRRGLPARYLLYLGTLEPRKNLEHLVRAFAQWRAATAAHDVRLVLAGARGWYYAEIFRTVEALGLTEQVIFPGFIPGDELPDWYAAATAFVYPSLFEGFGLPVLEAMACGTPVVCSRAPGVSEVAGDAAVTFAAHDVAALSAALELVVNQPGVRQALAARGRAQAARFTWRRAAEATLAIYRRFGG